MSASRSFRPTRSLPQRIASLNIIALTSITLAGSIGGSAFAAGQCEVINSGISRNGSYVYHFSDPAHPGIPLYQRYVSSVLQCDNGASLESTPVPLVADCDLPTCKMNFGREH
jgi:hypothetical protein